MVPILAWLLVIRPYARRHGQGYTPGANWGVTIWIDCQQALEIATRRRDRGMQRACRAFFAWLIIAGIILAIVAVASSA